MTNEGATGKRICSISCAAIGNARASSNDARAILIGFLLRFGERRSDPGTSLGMLRRWWSARSPAPAARPDMAIIFSDCTVLLRLHVPNGFTPGMLLKRLRLPALDRRKLPRGIFRDPSIWRI